MGTLQLTRLSAASVVDALALVSSRWRLVETLVLILVAGTLVLGGAAYCDYDPDFTLLSLFNYEVKTCLAPLSWTAISLSLASPLAAFFGLAVASWCRAPAGPTFVALTAAWLPLLFLSTQLGSSEFLLTALVSGLILRWIAIFGLRLRQNRADEAASSRRALDRGRVVQLLLLSTAIFQLLAISFRPATLPFLLIVSGSVVLTIQREWKSLPSWTVLLVLNCVPLTIPQSCHCGGALTACKSNLKNIGTACELYSNDNAGRYPASMAALTPNYLKVIPTCASAGKDTYSRGFRSATGPDAYTFLCGDAIIAAPARAAIFRNITAPRV